MATWPRGRKRQPAPHPDLRDINAEPIEPLGQILRRLLSRPEMRKGTEVGRLAMGWPKVVGEQLASETKPVALDQGALIVAVSSGPWGSQVTFLGSEIVRRANSELGSTKIRNVRVIVRPEVGKPLRDNGY